MSETIESWGEGWLNPSKALKSTGAASSEGTWWPAGKYVVPNERLRQLLGQSARWHARNAVTNFVSDDLNNQLQAAISAGSAQELMAKTYCATVAPSLLADRGNPHSVLMLSGKGTYAGIRATELRSATALEAISITKHLLPMIPVALPSPLPLRVRNAATHMALVATAQFADSGLRQRNS